MLLKLLTAILLTGCTSANTEQPITPPIDASSIQFLEGKCKINDCRKMPLSVVAERQRVADVRKIQYQARKETGSNVNIDSKVEQLMRKIQKAKVIAQESMGLDSLIVPEDDGKWQGDIYLSEQQADWITFNYNHTDSRSHRHRVKHAAALNNAQNPSSSWLWQMPIAYWFHQSFCKIEILLL